MKGQKDIDNKDKLMLWFFSRTPFYINDYCNSYSYGLGCFISDCPVSLKEALKSHIAQSTYNVCGLPSNKKKLKKSQVYGDFYTNNSALAQCYGWIVANNKKEAEEYLCKWILGEIKKLKLRNDKKIKL